MKENEDAEDDTLRSEESVSDDMDGNEEHKPGKKVIAKWIIAAVLLIAIIYTFRDSAVPVFDQLRHTSWKIIAGVCILSVLYELIEAYITYKMARMYNPDYRYVWGLGNAWYCAFYRLATLGSGTGVAAAYNLHKHGIGFAEGLGLYSIQYAIHKIAIALLSGILFLVQFDFMYEHYHQYGWQLILGYGLTVLITMLLVLFSCSKRFHYLLYRILNHFNKKENGALQGRVDQLRTECEGMETATKKLFHNYKSVILLLAVTMVKLCMWYAIPYVIIKGSGVTQMTLLNAVGVTTLSTMLAAAIPTPAGIGSTEFVFMILFGKITGSGIAGSTVLIYRFATFILPFIIGGVYVVLRHIKHMDT